jgi:hypothetical protein
MPVTGSPGRPRRPSACAGTRGKFVAKLPRERVEALVEARAGKPFEPGPGRRMKEWIEVEDRPSRWPALAREAHCFVSGR